MANNHELKTFPKFFEAVRKKEKTFELRKNDRDFKVGDTLVLREWDGHHFTGWYLTTEISYILECFAGLEPGYSVLGIAAQYNELHWQDPE